MPNFDELLSSLFPEGAEISGEQAEAIQGLRSAFNTEREKNEKNSKWIRDHMFAKPTAEKEEQETDPDSEDKRPQYEKDYERYLAHPGDFSHLIHFKK